MPVCGEIESEMFTKGEVAAGVEGQTSLDTAPAGEKVPVRDEIVAEIEVTPQVGG